MVVTEDAVSVESDEAQGMFLVIIGSFRFRIGRG